MSALRPIALIGSLLAVLVLPAVATARPRAHHRAAHKHTRLAVRAMVAATRRTPAAATKTTNTAATTTVPTVPILQPISPVAPADTTTLIAATIAPTSTPQATTVAPAPAPATPAAAAPAETITAPATTTTDTTATTTSAAAPPAATTSAAPAPRLFAADSFWNAPLPTDAPLDAQSSTYVSQLQLQLTTSLPWINTTSSSEPVYTVGSDQSTVKVTLDKAAPLDRSSQALADSWKAVPIPDNAAPAAGLDKNLVIYQPSTDTLWEFWQAVKKSDGWHAKWGGTMQNVSTNEGRFVNPNPRWGASATSLPLLGGLMRTSEIQAGHIDHALAMSLPQTRASIYSWPAQRTDGNVDSTSAIPEGTRFRLPADLDLSKMPMSNLVREMAVAAQKYGIVVRDRSGSVAFYGEDPTPTASTVWNLVFGGKYPSTLLAQFPWSKLQALQTQLAVDPI